MEGKKGLLLGRLGGKTAKLAENKKTRAGTGFTSSRHPRSSHLARNLLKPWPSIQARNLRQRASGLSAKCPRSVEASEIAPAKSPGPGTRSQVEDHRRREDEDS